MTRRASRNKGGNLGAGFKWIRPAKRCCIYARDQWCCVWCTRPVYTTMRCAPAYVAFRSVLVDARLATLDHVIPRDAGGTNDASNLLTACDECNARRGTTKPAEFAHVLAAGRGEDFEIDILERVVEARATPLAADERRKIRAA